MNWSSLVEQAVAIGLTQLAVVIFVVGLVVGLAIALMRRRNKS
jgi:flagellar biosynthesis protein FliQ